MSINNEISSENCRISTVRMILLNNKQKNNIYDFSLLLDQCGILLQLLQTNRGNSEEIDYFLVIKMLK